MQKLWLSLVGSFQQRRVSLSILLVGLWALVPQQLHATGGLDPYFNSVSANGPIMAVAQTPTGHIWIGGYFNSVNGSPHGSESYASSADQYFSLAVLNTNGTLNSDFSFSTFYSGLNSIIGSEWIYSYVRAIAVDQGQNTVYVALANRDNQPVIMRFDPVPGQPGKWTFNSSFTAATAHKMSSLWGLAVGDETIYVAGQVYDNTTTPAYSSTIGKFDLSGNMDNSYAPLKQQFGSSPVYQVRYVAPEAWVQNGTPYSSSSELLVAGSFGTAAISGNTISSSYSSDNATYSDVALRDANTAFNCPNVGGDLVAGGCLVPYISYNGLTYAGSIGFNLHRYGGNGGMDISSSTNSPADRGSGVSRVAALPDGDVLMCGEFSTIHGHSVNNLCHLLADGTVDQNFDNYLSFYPFDMAQQSDGKFIIGGIGLYTAPVFGGVYGNVQRLDAFPTNGVTITTQPASQTVYPGDTIMLSFNATGWPTLKAQWQKDGNDISGQTGDTLNLYITTNQAGTYNVVFQNGALCPTTVLSSNATVTVLPPPPAPANDMFSNAIPLTGASVQASGTIRSATLEDGELAGSDGRSVWWNWTAPYTGLATLDLSGCDFAASAQVYTGGDVTALTVVTNNYQYGYNCECTGLLQSFSFRVQAGTVYHIAFGGVPNSGTLGNINFTITEAHVVWNQASSDVTANFRAIVSHDNDNVIVGDYGAILHSTDGSHWNQVAPSTTSDSLYSVTYGNGTYAGVGDYATIVTSPDGINWTNQNSGQSTYVTLLGACFGQNKFVAVGYYGAVSTSTDGTNWTVQDTSSLGGPTLYSVTASANQFVAVGDNGTIATSPDGVSWTEQTNVSYYPLWSVAYGGGTYVAVGYNGTSFVSLDATNWTQISFAPSSSSSLMAVTYGNGRFVAVGYPGVIYLSTDGTNWVDGISGGSAGFSGVTSYNDSFVAVTTTGQIFTTKPPQVISPKRVGNDLQFTFEGLNGSTVVIEATATLAPPNWSPIYTNTLSNGGVDVQALINGPAQFYRARVQ